MDQDQYSQVTYQAEAKTSKHKLPTVLLSIGFVVLMASVALAGFGWWNAQNELKDTKSQLKQAQTLLSNVNVKVARLEAQVAGVNDAKRKADLASFAAVVRDYNAKNRTHLTTEGSMSKNIYTTELSKSIANFTDPKTNEIYDFVGVAKVQSPPPLAVGTIQYQWPGKCGAKTLIDSDDESLSAVATLLEDGSMYCLQV